VVDSEGRVLRFQPTRRRRRYWHGGYVAVDRAFRSAGLGRMLSEDFMRAVRRANACLVLEVAVSNIKVIGYRRGLGFRPLALRPRWYQQGTHDALMMYWGWMPPSLRLRLRIRLLAASGLSEAQSMFRWMLDPLWGLATLSEQSRGGSGAASDVGPWHVGAPEHAGRPF
jgi:hypothetical protein